MKKIFFIILILNVLFAAYKTRIKDITALNGIKKNTLKGYGLVVGLNGTGDSRNKLTLKTINQYLTHSGIQIDENYLRTKNCAVVAVTADTFGVLAKGDLITINAASISDAKSIDNGLLLQTVLKGADEEIYVVGQGVIDTGLGEQANPRRGVIWDGGIVEKDLGNINDIIKKNQFELQINNPDISTALSISEAIKNYNVNIETKVIDYKKILVSLPDSISEDIYKIISEISLITVDAYSTAKIIIDKNSGIVVVGENVKIDSAIISMPGIDIEVEQQKANNILQKNNTASDLAAALNNIGVQPNNIIAIFSALKKCGALNAEIVIQ